MLYAKDDAYRYAPPILRAMRALYAPTSGAESFAGARMGLVRPFQV